MPILGLLCFAWGVSVWLNLIVMMWFTYKNIDLLEDRLSGCRCISDTRGLWQGGIVGRHMRLNMVLMVTYMPGPMYRRGHITENAHLNIPRRLKWCTWGLYIWLSLNMICMAILCYAIKITASAKGL